MTVLTARRSDYAQLSTMVTAAGLLDRRPGYYAVRIGVTAGLFAAAWWGFVALGDSWAQIALAAGLAVVFAQVALVGHDIAHRQVFRSRSRSELVGRLAGNLGIGPNMPTPNLRRAQPIVRAYCQRLGHPYEETGLFASYAIALRHLHRVGTPLRASGQR
jgi:hypothetical protein